MQIESQTTQADASAWSAVVIVSGVRFVASFVAGKITADIAPYKFPPRRPRWAVASVKKWAETEVAKLPAAWHQAHASMYGIES
jgi:hypothetical protein